MDPRYDHLIQQNADFSAHAATRSDQRGARHDAIKLVLAQGDIECPAHSGRRRLRLSNRRAGELLADNAPVSLVEAALRIEIILGEADRIVTVLRCNPYPGRRRPQFHRRAGRI